MKARFLLLDSVTGVQAYRAMSLITLHPLTLRNISGAKKRSQSYIDCTLLDEQFPRIVRGPWETDILGRERTKKIAQRHTSHLWLLKRNLSQTFLNKLNVVTDGDVICYYRCCTSILQRCSGEVI